MKTYTIPGRLVPKKNSKRVYPGRKKPVGSPRWKVYEKFAAFTLMAQNAGLDKRTDLLHVTAVYYCPNRTQPDVSAMHETVGDLLEAGGIIENDKQIRSWDGSRIYIDRDNPRVEILVRRYIADVLPKGAEE